MTPAIKDLSPGIFWDTPIENINPREHGGFILERVMMYGELKDWKVLQEMYSIKELSSIATSVRNLDDFSISFLSLVLDVDKSQFRCYTEKQSLPSFWNY